MENSKEFIKNRKKEIIDWIKNVLDTKDFTIDEYSHIVYVIKDLQATTVTKSFFNINKEIEDMKSTETIADVDSCFKDIKGLRDNKGDM